MGWDEGKILKNKELRGKYSGIRSYRGLQNPRLGWSSRACATSGFLIKVIRHKDEIFRLWKKFEDMESQMRLGRRFPAHETRVLAVTSKHRVGVHGTMVVSRSRPGLAPMPRSTTKICKLVTTP